METLGRRGSYSDDVFTTNGLNKLRFHDPGMTENGSLSRRRQEKRVSKFNFLTQASERFTRQPSQAQGKFVQGNL